jgi:hypothetical protein
MSYTYLQSRQYYEERYEDGQLVSNRPTEDVPALFQQNVDVFNSLMAR